MGTYKCKVNETTTYGSAVESDGCVMREVNITVFLNASNDNPLIRNDERHCGIFWFVMRGSGVRILFAAPEK